MSDTIPVEGNPFEPTTVPVEGNPFMNVVNKAVDWYKSQPSWLERAAKAQASQDPKSLMPSEELLDFAKEQVGPQALSIENAAAKGIRAFHGSPHDFDRFDMSKIGTGEGAQAYGHGLYFAEHEPVAKSYRDTLADNATIGGQAYDMYNPLHVAAAQVEQSGSRAKAIEEIQEAVARDPGDPSRHYSRVLDILKSDKALPEYKPNGKMYEVNINANPEHFLDWDKPLSEQHPKVQEAFDRAYPSMLETSGSKTLQQAFPYGTNAATVRTLNEAGIPGIKYLDQGSRFNPGNVRVIEQALDAAKRGEPGRYSVPELEKQLADEKAKAASRNYVVFDDKMIDIVKKYGLAGLVAGGAAHYSMAPVTNDPFKENQQ